MSETVPAILPEPVPAPVGKPSPKKRGKKPSPKKRGKKPSPKKRGKKPVGLTGVTRKTPSPSATKLITEALSVSQERAGMSLIALKKALAAAGYDVERNNNRIKLGLKSLVSKGVLVQTRGTGASGSFKLNKKAVPEPTKGRITRPASKTKKLVLSRDSKSGKSAKTKKRAKKPRAAGAKKAARSGGKVKGAKTKQQRKSPAKARTVKPKTGKPKLTQQKTNPRKSASKK